MYLFEIINEHFEVGQRYIGRNNGVRLVVDRIQEVGGRANRPMVHFRDEKSGRILIHDLETAKRLQLQLVK